MTTGDKNRIRKMRFLGMSFGQIAKKTGYSQNTIKSFFRRDNMQNSKNTENNATCKNCGIDISQTGGHRQRKFCSEKCRFAWWHGKDNCISSDSSYVFECKNCGKEIKSYGRKDRKYCCYACYIADRFKR